MLWAETHVLIRLLLSRTMEQATPTLSVSVPMLLPQMEAEPEVAFCSPESSDSVVDLPAPLGPDHESSLEKQVPHTEQPKALTGGESKGNVLHGHFHLLRLRADVLLQHTSSGVLPPLAPTFRKWDATTRQCSKSFRSTALLSEDTSSSSFISTSANAHNARDTYIWHAALCHQMIDHRHLR